MEEQEPPEKRTARHVVSRMSYGPVDIRHLVQRPTWRKRAVRWLRKHFTRSKCGCPCRTCRTYCGACSKGCDRW